MSEIAAQEDEGEGENIWRASLKAGSTRSL